MKRYIVPLLFLIFGFQLLWADEVTLVGDNIYETPYREITKPVNNKSVINLNAVSYLSGNIRIIGDGEDEVVVVSKKNIKINSESKAIEYSKLMTIEASYGPTDLNIILQTPNPAPWSEASNICSFDIVVHVPSKCEINIDAIYFDLNVDGPIRSLTNRSSLGTMNIANISENLDLSGSNRKINLKNIGGTISIFGDHSDIKMDNVRSGDKPVYIRNDNGNIVIDDIFGAMEIKNSFGKIRIHGASLFDNRSRIICEQSPLKLEIGSISEAVLIITTKYENVNLVVPTDISSEFELNTDNNGEIHIVGVGIITEEIRADFLRATAGDGESKIYIDIENGGDIYINGE